MRTLHPLLPIRNAIVRLRILIWNSFWKMNIHPSSRISLQAKLDKTYPVGVHIHEQTTITFGVTILTHDMVRNLRADTVIERNCFIGAHSIILPGVTVGEGSIVAAGSVVVNDVVPHSIVAGNPAKVIRENIKTGPYGVLEL